MEYVCYELDEDPESGLVWYERLHLRLYNKFDPLLSPDFHEKYSEVIYWWLELNSDAIAVREVGFNSDRIPIVIGPLDKNFGVFTHEKQKIRGFYPVEMFQFIEQWEYFLEEYDAKI